jgi:flagellar hook assembly protein FlgD
LRKSVFALAFALVAALGMYVPSVSAAYVSTAKVVIIVGAVHGQTDSYRQRGDAAYAEAIKYTPNVTKVYSPYATWTKVVSATKGANIVIYMGHGNGWPSPYTYDPAYTTKDGFGLNSTSGNGDHNNKYYGEPSVAQLQLAPNAIILLHHLCYASGNGESSSESPTTSIAKQRVQNYAAGFLKSPARAVIADGHRGAGDYLRALFTTNQTILQLWRSVGYHNNEFSFASGRSAGYTAYMDPEAPQKFYRSMVAKPTLTTREITGVVGDTGTDPASFTVPGRASVVETGADLLGVDGLATATLDAGTRLRSISRPTWTAPEGTPVIEVTGFDDETITGFVRINQIVPRDSTAPLLLGVDAAPSGVSPNDDDAFDRTQLSARFSENVNWTLEVEDADGDEVAQASGTGKEPIVEWDGLLDGDAVPDGTYRYTFRGNDAWRNAPSPVARYGTVRIDTTAPTLSDVAAPPEIAPWFSPNGDGVRDTFTVRGSTSEAGRISVRVSDDTDTSIRNFSVAVPAGAFAIAWNGRDNDGQVAPNGKYTVRVTPVDRVENVGAGATAEIWLVNMLGAVVSSKSVIYPQDLDSLGSITKLSYRLDRQATVTWTIRNSAGQVVDTILDGQVRAAGPYSINFAGRTRSGSMLPAGKYTSHISTTDGDDTIAHAAPFQMNAFAVTSSTSTPTRGRSVTITAVSAESLSSSVSLRISQPGKSSWSVKMVRLSSGAYRATVTLKTGGSAGTVQFRVLATDARGQSNRTYLTLALR